MDPVTAIRNKIHTRNTKESSVGKVELIVTKHFHPEGTPFKVAGIWNERD